MAREVPLRIRRHPLVAKLRSFYRDRTVLVGVSGGADSIALLLISLAVERQKSTSCTIVVAHIHHGLRAESDDEQQLVETLCRELDVPLHVERVNVTPHNGSLAAGARKARYKALEKIAAHVGATCISVAHHSDDQLETMLMALCRGGGIRKLAGMASERCISKNLTLVRPLLQTQKEKLIAICKDAGVPWCEDPTNHDAKTPRGRLRNDVLPVLHDIWQSASKHASNASLILQAAADVFESTAPSGTKWNRKEFSDLPLPVIAESLHLAIGDNAKNETIQSIAEAVSDTVQEPRMFECSNSCSVSITAHVVEVLYT